MRRLVLVALSLVALWAVMTPAPAEGATTGARSVAGTGFRIIDPAATWPCAEQKVYVDWSSAGDPTQPPALVEGLRLFRKATGRAWPETTDADEATLTIRWNAGNLTGNGWIGGVPGQHVEIVLAWQFQYNGGLGHVLHELGHAGGLDHFDDRSTWGGVMWEHSYAYTKYSVGDLAGLSWMSQRRCNVSANRR